MKIGEMEIKFLHRANMGVLYPQRADQRKILERLREKKLLHYDEEFEAYEITKKGEAVLTDPTRK